MLAVVGYNFSRFHLSIDEPARPVACRGRGRSVGSPSRPSPSSPPAWCSSAATASPRSGSSTTTSDRRPTARGVGTTGSSRRVVQILVVLTALFLVPSVRRLDRRRPYVLPLVLARRRPGAAGELGRHRRLQQPALPDPRCRLVLPARLARPPIDDDPPRSSTTTAICLVTIPGFFGRTERGVVHRPRSRPAGVVSGRARCPGSPCAAIAVIAAASMAIFVTHFRIFPPLQRNLPLGVAYVATIGAGVAIWLAGQWLLVRVRPVRRT